MIFKFIKKYPETQDITTFFFQAEKKMRYIAGQYTQLTIPHERPDNRKTKRWFTLSSSPTEELLSITTRLSPKSSTFKQALQRLKPGETIHGHLPMGDFVLPKDESIPLVFVAAGIGITPYRSMLKYLQDRGNKRNITLIYAATSEDDMVFKEILTSNTSRFIPHKGRLNGKQILDYTGKITDQFIYISGPENMVETIQKELLSQGINALQVRTDTFPNYD